MVKFTVMSREQAKNYTFSEQEKVPYIMISINDANSMLNMFKADPMLKGVCFLCFNDVDNGFLAMQKKDAKKILQFVDEHIFDISEIIVHCGAGISRSAGVCAALMKILTLCDNQIFDSPKYKPNMHCYRTILDAYFGSGSFGSVKADTDIYPIIALYREQSAKQAGHVCEETQIDVCADKPMAPQEWNVSADKNIYNQKKSKNQKAIGEMNNQAYVICIKKVADIYGNPLNEQEHEYEYAQLDTRNALSRGYPDWGPEQGAMKFNSELAALAWYKQNKEHLRAYKQQYDWKTLSVRQMSCSYIPIEDEDEDPDFYTQEEAIDLLSRKQIEADNSCNNAAAGYDEGYYSGMEEAFGIALEIVKKIKP